MSGASRILVYDTGTSRSLIYSIAKEFWRTDYMPGIRGQLFLPARSLKTIGKGKWDKIKITLHKRNGFCLLCMATVHEPAQSPANSRHPISIYWMDESMSIQARNSVCPKVLVATVYEACPGWAWFWVLSGGNPMTSLPQSPHHWYSVQACTAATQEANKSREELLEQGIVPLVGKPANQEDGGLMSQRTISPELEFRLLLH